MDAVNLRIERDAVRRDRALQASVGALPKISNRESHLLELLATRTKQTKEATSNRNFIARFASRPATRCYSGANSRSRLLSSRPENRVARAAVSPQNFRQRSRRGIRDLRAMNLRERSELVRPCRFRSNNIGHGDTAHQKRVRDQRTMATPRHRFRAHHGASLFARELDQPLQSRIEFRRLHVIRETSKGRISPSHVDRIGPRVPQPSERR
jgi:hypothetical protein